MSATVLQRTACVRRARARTVAFGSDLRERNVRPRDLKHRIRSCGSDRLSAEFTILSRQATLLHLAMPMRCVLRVECDRMCSILSACVAFTDGCAAPALRRVRHYLLRAAYVRTQRGLGAALVDRSRWRVFPCSFRIGIVYVADGQTTEEVPWRGARVQHLRSGALRSSSLVATAQAAETDGSVLI